MRTLFSKSNVKMFGRRVLLGFMFAVIAKLAVA
jgi:hypothetical protein